MHNDKFQLYSFLALLAATLVLMFFIFKPFLAALALAAIFAVVFRRPYRRLLKIFRQRAALAALTGVVLVVVLVLTPLIFLGAQIFYEAGSLYSSLAAKSGQLDSFAFSHLLPAAWQPYFSSLANINFENYLNQGLSWLIKNVGAVFSSLAKVALNLFLFLIAFFYFLKDGDKIKQKIFELSPLAAFENHIIFEKLRLAVYSVVTGNLIVEIIHGLLVGAGLFLFGVPNPLLWGAVAAVAAMVPALGTALIIVPAAGYLFLIDKLPLAGALIIWGLLINAFVDNFLAPRVVSRGICMHRLIALLSVLGGLAFFGPIGFIFGPLVASLLLTLVEIYAGLLKKGAS